MMHPAIIEAGVLALMGLSGVGAGLLLGVRQVIPLTIVALAATTVIRVWSAFAVWSLGLTQWNAELWLSVSLLVIVVAAMTKWSLWRAAGQATGLFGLMSLVALGTKYVLDIGERHHSDVSNVLGVAVIAIQGDLADLEPISSSYKRGIAYPLMLALGPDGRILGAFTPLLFLMLILASVWLAWKIVGNRTSWKVFAGVGLAVGVFSVTVPIFRAAMFYLNGHTLMAFGLSLLVAGFVLARAQNSFSGLPLVLTILGGVIGVTARIEGVALVLVIVVALLGQPWWSGLSDRWRLFGALALIGLTLTWWMVALERNALERLGLPGWVLLAVTILGASLAASPWLDRFRLFAFPAVAAMLTALLAREVWQSGDPLALILSQWPNLGLGRGGWATAALVFVGSAVVLGIRRRSPEYRWLLVLCILVIEAILFSKTFDGGFGREGFYDSVNRMWLHVLPLVITTTLVGYSEVLRDALASRRGPSNQDGKPPTAATVAALG